MKDEPNGLIAQLRNEGMLEGINEGKRQIILSTLQNHTIKEVAEFTKIDEIEIINILNKTL